MVTSRKKPINDATSSDQSEPANSSAAKKTAASGSARKAPPASPLQEKKMEIPAIFAPNLAPHSKPRKRLSKAFSRPLDKQLRKVKSVRDRFTFTENEYEQLSLLKKRLADQGVISNEK